MPELELPTTAPGAQLRQAQTVASLRLHFAVTLEESTGVMRMGTTTEVIRSRTSVRTGYTSTPISQEALNEILQCGLCAPSSKDAQPWRLHVVEDRAVLAAIADDVAGAEKVETFVPADPLTEEPRKDLVSTVLESADVLRSVPVGVFIENRGEFSRSRKVVAMAQRDKLENLLIGFSLEAVGLGAAIENMWLAALELGLSAVFMGDILIAESAIQTRLGATGDMVGVLAIGESTSVVTKHRTIKEDRYVLHS